MSSNGIMNTVKRMGTALALGTVLATGFVSTANAQGYYRQDPEHRWDRDRQYKRQSLGRNRYRYFYNGQNYDYTIDNRRGNTDVRDVTQRAQQSGYNQGLQDGSYDGVNATRPNPNGHGAYQFGLDGWDPGWGWGSTYQRVYRQAYLRGYNEGFRRNDRRPGRRG